MSGYLLAICSIALLYPVDVPIIILHPSATKPSAAFVKSVPVSAILPTNSKLSSAIPRSCIALTTPVYCACVQPPSSLPKLPIAPTLMLLKSSVAVSPFVVESLPVLPESELLPHPVTIVATIAVIASIHTIFFFIL
ncbi:hypothetical protein SDC9_199758 [bioreactor metagenome]|uniref:Uncharacterized protein n=1 Tax=bioreactor metagenome TaxID=1076179 RepID=A0A645IUN4_9ZZZZ